MAADPLERRRQIRRLQLIKVLRSVGQGALLVVFAIYLDDLGWQGGEIGFLLAAGGFLTAALGLPVGIASDRVGRKSFVLINEAVIVVSAALATVSSHPAVIAIASVFGAFGRGQVGMIGPAGPAEQAWMAELTEPRERSRVYSTNSALGFVGTGIGSLLAGLVPLWQDVLPGTLAYRPFFALAFVAGVVNLFLIAGTRTMGELRQIRGGEDGSGEAEVRREEGRRDEGRRGERHLGEDRPEERRREGRSAGKEPSGAARRAPAAARGPLAPAEEAEVRRRENILLSKLCGINALNGAAVGLTSPLISYWFYLKFGVGPEALGPVFAVTNFATAVTSVATGRAAERIGIVRSVVGVRLLAVVFLLVLPFVPSFGLAAVLHIVRSALSRGTAGTRQALTVSLVRDERRGFASSMNSLSTRLPNAIGPWAAGVMLQSGNLALPFLVAAGAQFLYGTLFGRVFQDHDPNAPAASRAAAARRAGGAAV